MSPAKFRAEFIDTDRFKGIILFLSDTLTRIANINENTHFFTNTTEGFVLPKIVVLYNVMAFSFLCDVGRDRFLYHW